MRKLVLDPGEGPEEGGALEVKRAKEKEDHERHNTFYNLQRQPHDTPGAGAAAQGAGTGGHD